jgi:hypothetical protein
MSFKANQGNLRIIMLIIEKEQVFGNLYWVYPLGGHLTTIYELFSDDQESGSCPLATVELIN